MNTIRSVFVLVVLVLIVHTSACGGQQREVSNNATAAPQSLDETTAGLHALARTTALQILEYADRTDLRREQIFEETGGLLSSTSAPPVLGESQQTPSLQLDRNFGSGNGEGVEPDKFGYFTVSATAPTSADELCDVRIAFRFTQASVAAERRPLTPALLRAALQADVGQGRAELNTIDIYPSVQRTYQSAGDSQQFLYVDVDTGRFGYIVNGDDVLIPVEKLGNYRNALTRTADCIARGFR